MDNTWLVFTIFLGFLFSSINGTSQTTVGLFTNTPNAYNGYTLFAPMNTTTTYLIDNCGEVVNSWQSNYRPGNSAYLLEDGSLLRTARVVSTVFSGGGIGGRIERFDWNGTLTWSYEIATSQHHQHHDIAYLPNGNILVLAWDYQSNNDAISQGRNPSTIINGVWGEKVMELQPVGTDSAIVVWEWRLFDHLVQDFDVTKANYGIVSQHPELMDFNYVNNGGGGPGSQSDWVHANAINYNPQLDQIVISCRNFDEFWVIDHSTTTAEAATHTGGNSGKGGDFLYRWGNPMTYDRGTPADQRLFKQHDAQWIEQGLYEEGKFLVFNNGVNRVGVGNYSSVETITPPVDANGNYSIDTIQPFIPTEPDWIYTGSPTFDFYSSFISGAQRLPNSNTLICEGDDGRLFEVDTLGTIVWEYINPAALGGPVSQGNSPGNNTVFRAYRYSTTYPAFIGKTLTPNGPIELNPTPSNCQIYLPTHNINKLEGVSILGNPVEDVLKIKNLTSKELSITLLEVSGREVRSLQSNNYITNIPVSDLAKGIYILKIYHKEDQQFLIKKILKQ